MTERRTATATAVTDSPQPTPFSPVFRGADAIRLELLPLAG